MTSRTCIYSLRELKELEWHINHLDRVNWPYRTLITQQLGPEPKFKLLPHQEPKIHDIQRRPRYYHMS